MNPAAALRNRIRGYLRKHDPKVDHASERPIVLAATIDPAIRSGLAGLFEAFPFNTIWLESVEAAKSMLAGEKIAACISGFWLQDGTYRELVRHVRRERMKIPLIIASAPSYPDEYRGYLAAMSIGALDYLCYPYRSSDLERMLGVAMNPQIQSVHRPSALIAPELRTDEAA
jgi:DNA-binding NtrC family response regulator